MKLKLLPSILTLLLTAPISVFGVEIGVYISVDANLVSTVKTQNDWLAEMDQLIFESNEIYEESGVDIQLVPSRVDFRSMAFSSSSQLLNMIAGQQNEFNNILNEADKTGGDYIIAITDLEDFGLCGQAIRVNRTARDISITERAIGLSDPDCGEDTFVHELGHLMGLAHGSQVAESTGNNAHLFALNGEGNFQFTSLPYATGWGRIVEINNIFEEGEYGTVMVGNHVFNWTGTTSNNVKVPLFSSPNTHHPLCGQEGCGDSNDGDAVRVLNENRFTYASHEEIDADHLTYDDSRLTNCLLSNHSHTEIVDLQSLNCVGFDISNIGGIEQLTSLVEINLANNRIVNLSSLETFSNSTIYSINLDGNNTALCHQLEQLEEQFPGKIIMPEQCFNIGAFIATLSVLN